MLLSWGANSYGQLGQGRKCEEVRSPNDVQLESDDLILSKISNIEVGANQSFLLLNDGTVYGCGLSNVGQLGDTNPEEYTFVKLISLSAYKIIQLSCKWDACHAITSDGLCIGWGANTFGQLGINPNQIKQTKEPIVLCNSAMQVAAGLRHSAVLLKNGKVKTAGICRRGQLGRKFFEEKYIYDYVEDLENVAKIACGQNFTLALTTDRKLYGWGCNKFGQLGITPARCQFSDIPLSIELVSPLLEEITLNDFIQLKCGWTHCILQVGKKLFTWGRNNYGQLGISAHNVPYSHTMVEVLTGENVKSIAVGAEHNLLITENGMLKTWGWNEHGSCGDGSNNCAIFQPVVINTSPEAKVIGAGSAHSFCLFQ